MVLYSLLLLACGNNTGGEAEPQVEVHPADTLSDTLTEDQILLQLSPYLIADPQTQSERDQNAIVDYAIREMLPLERTPAGVFYRVLAAGQDDLLAWGDYIKVHYKGYFLHGKVFDDTRLREKPLQFYIGNMIQGWNEGLQQVAPGGSILLLVPSTLAYGEEGLPNAKGGLLVPPHTPLVFEIEVLERIKRAETQ